MQCSYMYLTPSISTLSYLPKCLFVCLFVCFLFVFFVLCACPFPWALTTFFIVILKVGQLIRNTFSDKQVKWQLLLKPLYNIITEIDNKSQQTTPYQSIGALNVIFVCLFVYLFYLLRRKNGQSLLPHNS